MKTFISISLIIVLVAILSGVDCGRCNPGLCTQNYDPVCGSDGKTYPNKCTFDAVKCRNKQLKVRRKGKCAVVNKLSDETDSQSKEKKRPSACVCTANYDPVCGSDKQTYGNQCELKCAAKRHKGLRKVKKGPCGVKF